MFLLVELLSPEMYVDKWGLSWAKLSRAGVKPGVGQNWLL